jgi:hypothetical protein
MATKKHNKIIRREQRIAARVTEELYTALQDRAYQEHKTMSTLVVEALIQLLNFKMPERVGKKS